MSGISGEYTMRVASSPGVALTIAPQHEVEGKLEGNPSLGYLHNGYAGQSVTLGVEPAGGYPLLDLSITIVALTDMRTVLLEVDENGAGQGETAVFLPPADDEYYVVVEGEDGSSGVFVLTMTEP